MGYWAITKRSFICLAVCVAAMGFPLAEQRATSARVFTDAKALDDGSGDGSNISAGDVDRDGDLDLVLVVGRHGVGFIDLFVNDGRGNFAPRTLGNTPSNTYAAPLLDVDGDGDLDIAVGTEAQDARFLYLNDGKGGFQAAGTWSDNNWEGSRNIAVADLNGDRLPDLMVALRSGLGQPPNPSSVCINNGQRRFQCNSIPTESTTTIVPIDVDRDADLDLVVPHRDTGETLILFNEPGGKFDKKAPLSLASSEVRGAAAGDLNGDRLEDLVLGDMRNGVFVYLNDGRGRFQSAGRLTERRGSQQVALEDVQYSIFISDMNRDGRPDIVLGNAGATSMVLFSSGDGRHFSSVPFADAAGEVYGLAVGDFDGDKYPDIAVARTAAPTSVYFSRSGKSGAEISTSESFVPRVPLSEGLPRSGANPLLGVWEGGLASGRSGVSRGIRLRSSEPFQIELTLRSLTVGSTAGHSIFHSTKSVVRCLVTNTVERVDGQSYILRDGAEPCGLAQHSFRITLVGPDSLELQFLAPEPGKPSVVTTTLTRKLPRR